MSRLIDLSGQRFKYLTVIERAGVDTTNKTTWLCNCDCGNTVVVTGLNLKSGNSKSCGCKKHLKGLDNPRTITDPVRLQERKRALGTVKTWRKTILKNNPLCVKCGSNQNLHVHHIVGFSDCLNLRTDPSNGVTLCQSCHNNFHSIYGRKTGFNEMNLNNWLVGVNERSPIVCIGESLSDEIKNIIKYVTRYKEKNGMRDLEKARHYLDKLIEVNSAPADVACNHCISPAACEFNDRCQKGLAR
jgi:5-methylcytosine-specific restriction endonuclease McrA